MKESIYTIPIHEAFEAKEGCPFCRLEAEAEQNSLDYIMGAAMMEPDVRETINLTGFCHSHYARMLAMNNRLSLALTMESRLKKLRALNALVAKNGTKAAPTLTAALDGCFVCQRTADVMEHYYSNTLEMWRTDSEFQTLFQSAETLCMHHGAKLTGRAGKLLPRKLAGEFLRTLSAMQEATLAAQEENISTFCATFDYRYKGEPYDTLAAERAAGFLSGGSFLPKDKRG